MSIIQKINEYATLKKIGAVMSMGAVGAPVAYHMLNPPAIYAQAPKSSKPEYVEKSVGFKEALELFDGCLDKDEKKDGKISKEEFVRSKVFAVLDMTRPKNPMIYQQIKKHFEKKYGNEFDKFYDLCDEHGNVDKKDGFITNDDRMRAGWGDLEIEIYVLKKKEKK